MHRTWKKRGMIHIDQSNMWFEIKGEWLAQQVRIVVELTPLLVLEYFDMSTLRLTEKILAN